MIGATLWAAFSRFYQLESLPPPAWVDEIWFALRGRELLAGGPVTLFYKTFWGGIHPLLVLLTALAQALGLAPSLVASRAVSAVAGVVSVPLAYAACDELLRPPAGSAWAGWPRARRRLTAALAALLLSNLLFYVVVSRVGTEPALAAAAAAWCVWQLARALRWHGSRRGWLAWLLAGAGIGLSQYISPHARFILPVVAWIGLHRIVTAPAERRAGLASGLGAAAVVSLLVGLPLALFFAREPEWFWARASAVTAGSGPAFWLENLRRIGWSLSVAGDLNLRHNLPGRPIFDWVQSLGLWVGLGWALVRCRHAAPARDLLVWAAVMLLPSVLTDGAPQYERLVGLAAPAAALVAIGWVALGQAADAWWRARARPAAGPWPRLIGTGLLALSLAANTGAYFSAYPRVAGLKAAFTATPVDLARTLATRVETETVFVERLPEADDVLAFEFLLPGTAVRRLDFRQCLPLADDRQTRTTYLVLSQRDPQSARALAGAYPDALRTAIHPEAAALMGEAKLVEVPPGSAAPSAPYPAHAQFAAGVRLLGYDWSGPLVRPGESLFLTLYWKAETDVSADWTAFAHLGTGLQGEVNVAQRDGQPCQGLYPTHLWRAGDVVPDSFAITVAPGTPAGDYGLAVGWYQFPGLERMPLLAADQALPDNRALIAAVTVGE